MLPDDELTLTNIMWSEKVLSDDELTLASISWRENVVSDDGEY